MITNPLNHANFVRSFSAATKDHRSHGAQALDKKSGGGKGNWGRPGEELQDIDPHDMAKTAESSGDEHVKLVDKKEFEELKKAMN